MRLASRKRSSRVGLVCELDLEKDYDHVNWNFLLLVMEKMGFGSRWLRWIQSCISLVRMLVLVGGAPTKFFRSYRVLRQEDPLSFYLLILLMEAFSCLVSKTV